MTVRAKLTVENITEIHGTWGTSKTVNFRTQYDNTIPEDQRFQKATPSGSASFNIDNPAALEQFQPGYTFYVDFTLVPKT
jgi:hypothetical protein